jgi:hypothetical protein
VYLSDNSLNDLVISYYFFKKIQGYSNVETTVYIDKQFRGEVNGKCYSGNKFLNYPQQPHDGRLVDKVVTGKEREEELVRAK